jgi:hypothetical protein
MTTTRYGQTATRLLDGRVLLAGGWSTNDQPLAAAEIFDPKAGTFTATGSMISARAEHSATLLSDGRVLIAGGLDDSGTLSELASAEIYDPKAGAFSATGSMTRPRAGLTATFLQDGRVLIAGADPDFGPTSAELYDPGTGSFRATGPMISPRTGHTATLLRNGEVLIVGGSDKFQALASAELYDAQTGTFRATGSMASARLEHTSTLLSDSCGCVLIAGGSGANGDFSPMASVELYDPAMGTFTPTGSMTTPRDGHTATLLADGLVLISGGKAAPTGELSSAELYDAASGTFRSTGSMTAAESGHTATLLLDGRILIAGGTKFDAPAEIYDPATSTFGPVG